VVENKHFKVKATGLSVLLQAKKKQDGGLLDHVLAVIGKARSIRTPFPWPELNADAGGLKKSINF
jgi:hypothetical protein